jgi:inorganic pyrophosphatase
MDLNKVSIGKNPPWDVHVVIEIPQGGSPIKYEIDKESGALFVDRFINTAMFYPANYGFIPHTLADDGDPIDVLVIGDKPIISGAIIRVRPVGVLLMEDEKGHDEKIIAVPVHDVHPYYDDIRSCDELPVTLCDQITHFFSHYKDLEQGKWVKISGWGNAEEASRLISKAIEQARDTKKSDT